MAFALARMKSFTVHLHPQRRPLAEHAQFVPEGFNVWAFAFGWLWAASQRMWWLCAALLVAVVVLKVLEMDGILTAFDTAVLQALFSIFVGCEANDWRREHLAARGWLMSDIVAEDSLLHAQQRYFARHANLLQPTANPLPASAPTPAPAMPAAGPWGGTR